VLNGVGRVLPGLLLGPARTREPARTTRWRKRVVSPRRHVSTKQKFWQRENFLTGSPDAEQHEKGEEGREHFR